MACKIVTRVDDALGLSEFLVHGVPTGRDFVQTIQEHYRDKPTPLAIWDLTRASLSSLEPADFRKMASAADAFSELRGDSPKTAVIIEDGIESILGRLYKDISVVNASAVAYHVVQTRDEALAWLTSAD